jgi:NAD(P)-dependent dehydrogenase (short-subunit alcohol dehydrogenase family)
MRASLWRAIGTTVAEPEKEKAALALAKRRRNGIAAWLGIPRNAADQRAPDPVAPKGCRSASKAALINFMQCAAKDLGPHNVRVNALAPGMVKTELNESIWAAGQKLLPEAERLSFDDWAAAKIKKVSHLGRWQMPEEYAAMACFLASNHAKNITGQTLNIDGGQVMHA